MRQPDFFILGAPKCGTTSMAAWLSSHPAIFMSPVKEPHYFNTDLDYINTHSPRQYRRLFKAVHAQHEAVGEASVFYLYSKIAVPRIEREQPSARYIVLLRNPVDMAYSLHEQQLFAGNEHIADFAEAWRISERRLAGQAVARACREPRLLAYHDVCALGGQLARLYGQVPAERVLVLLLDDVHENPRREYRRVLDFLGVPDDGQNSLPATNRAKARRSPMLRRAVKGLNDGRRKLGIPRIGTGLMDRLDKLNRMDRARPPMPTWLRDELTNYFRDDVRLLASLLDRHLSHWLRTVAESEDAQCVHATADRAPDTSVRKVERP